MNYNGDALIFLHDFESDNIFRDTQCIVNHYWEKTCGDRLYRTSFELGEIERIVPRSMFSKVFDDQIGDLYKLVLSRYTGCCE
jgi:hypothetical protein